MQADQLTLEHNHEHTHDVNNPGGDLAHPALRHKHSHQNEKNYHHYYFEEPDYVEKRT